MFIHANVAERVIRTITNMIHDRVRFNNGRWTAMLSKTREKYDNADHSSTKINPRMPTMTKTIWMSELIRQEGEGTHTGIKRSK